MVLDEVRKVVQPELEQDFDALYEEFVTETGETDVVEFLLHLHDFGLISEELVRQLAGDEGRAAPEDAAPPGPVAPISWDDDEDDDGEATVLARASDLIKIAEEAAEKHTSRSGVTQRPVAPTPEVDTLSPRNPDPSHAPPAQPTSAKAASQAPTARPPGPEAGRPKAPEVPSGPPTLARQGERDPVTPTAAGDRPAGGGMSFLPEFNEPTEATPDPEDDDLHSQKRTMFRKKDGKWQETDAFTHKAKPKVERQIRRAAPKRQIARDDKRYTFLDATVGEGAMGKVFLAVDNILNRKIAYKEMSSEIAEQPALASKFSAEAQITAQLEHPNIVPVYALEGDVAYTMKLVRGRTVDDLIRETRTLIKKGARLDEDHTLEARLDLFLKVCDAIAYANSRGVVHRDLKPENIMVGEFGEVYVMDWGIAMIMANVQDGPRIQDMEDEGELIIGTAGYMSPEQADARNTELTGASDQYALGLILHELLSMRPAVSGKNAVHILTRQQLGETDRLIPFGRERIPPELAAIVAKATQNEPARRFRTVDELADDVRRFLRGEAVRSKPDNPWQAMVRWSARHRQATLLSVMMVIFGSVLFVMFVGVYAQVSLSRAAAREQALSGLVTSVSRHASYVDGQFTRFAGLLLLVSTTAEDMLTLGDGVGRHVYRADVYTDPLRQPQDLAASPRYGMPISAQHAAYTVLPDAGEYVTDLTLPRLAPMDRHFQKVLLRSHSEEAAQYTPRRASRAISEIGLPIAWAYVALDNGAYGVFPGHGGYAPTFDPRSAPWYKAAVAGNGPVWGLPMVDEDGGSVGVVVPCSTALKDSEGKLLGVAGIDVTFDHLAKELTALEGLAAAGGTAYVLDAQGRVLIDPAGSRDGSVGTPPTFSNPEVIAGIQARRSGYVEVGSEILVYTRMASSDWYYVVRGPTDRLLAGIH